MNRHVIRLDLQRSGSSTVVRLGRTTSLLLHRRTWAVGGVLLALVLALCVVATAIGTEWMPLDEVLGGLVGLGDRAATLTVQYFRLPRVAVGLFVGIALGLAGALVQGVTRNPIASPDVIGVTAGASFGAVATLLFFGGTTFGYGGADAALSRIGLPLGAILGAFLAAALVLGVGAAHRSSGAEFATQRIVLVGIVCHAAFIGLVQWGLTRGDVDQASKAAVWLIGSLSGRGWEHAFGIGLALVVLLPAALLLGRRLGVIALGDAAAATLGIKVRRTQLGLFVVAFALAGAAAAAAGPVSFVALMAPQIARRVVRSPGIPLVASALVGAALVLSADLLARLVIPGTELPAGAVTALVGAPYLLWLVVRSGGHR